MELLTNPDTALLFIGIVAGFISIFIAISYQNNIKNKCISCKPFMWGYWQGSTGALSGVGLILLGCYLAESKYTLEEGLFLIGLGVLAFILGLMILKRNRWAFLIHTIISFNPILWLINGIYLKNRWLELNINIQDYSADNPLDITNIDIKESSKLSKKARIFIVLYVTYFIGWSSILYIAEPFGYSYNDEDVFHAIAIYLIPVIVYPLIRLSIKFINAADD